MDSFFFNITDTNYKITPLFENKKEHITRIDISNGVVFFDIYLNVFSKQEFHVKNLDRMVVIPVTKKGSFTLRDNFIYLVFGSCKRKMNCFAFKIRKLSFDS